MVLCALSVVVLMRERSSNTATGAGAAGSAAHLVAAEMAASPAASARSNTGTQSAMPSASLTELQMRPPKE